MTKTNQGSHTRRATCHSTRQERQRRMNAVHRSAACAKGLWKTNARYATKRAALLAHVVGPILSGAEAVLHTDTDWITFDQTIASYGRRALNGRAFGQADGRKTVWWYTRPGPTRGSGDFGNYTVRKLKPESEGSAGHRNSRADPRHTAKSSLQSTSNQGRITRPITGWRKGSWKTYGAIEETVEGGDDFIKEMDGRWMRLFCHTPKAERSQKVDMAEIRARGKPYASEEEEEDEEAVVERRGNPN